jgi:hypothetical protein
MSGTRWHYHFEIADLLARSDESLEQVLTGGTPAEIRTTLVLRKAAGKTYLTVGGCDNVGKDGKCCGHPIP